MIFLIKEPVNIHSANCSNWFYFQSDFRFAPQFNLRTNFVNEDSSLINSLLVPTNPDALNVVNTGPVLSDFVGIDPKPFILGPSASDMEIDYRVELSESFEGLYIGLTSAVARVEFVDVLNNTQLLEIGLPAKVRGIGFINGIVNTPIDDIFVINYGTASGGFVSSLELSESPTASTAGIDALASGFGFLQFEEVILYSIGATFSTDLKTAIKADIDYLPWTQDNDFSLNLIGSDTSQFQTRLNNFDIASDEWMTLSFISGTTVSTVDIVDNLGATYSKSVNILPSQSKRIDIPSGTRNLFIGPSASSYTITLRDSLGDPISETVKINIKNNLSNRGSCLPGNDFLNKNIRVVWLNDLGGWDYFTFKYAEQKSRIIQRETYQKNLRYNTTKRDRGFTSYKIDDFTEWELVSDLVDARVSDWITSLFTSDSVYLIYDDELYPIEVLSDSHLQDVGWELTEVRLNVRLSRGNVK